MTSTTSTEGTRKRGRPRRNKTQRSGEAVITKEETIITQKVTEPAKAKEQVFKLVPKKAPVPVVTAAKKSASIAPVIPTKVTILPKKRVQKITILSKTPKKLFVPTVPLKTETKTEAKTQAKTEVKQKIILPSQTKKTRKQYKERRLRIEL